jgi:hypothetical protein
MAASRGKDRSPILTRINNSTAGSSASARKTAITAQRSVVVACMRPIASSAAIAAISKATITIFETALDSMSLARTDEP